MIKAKAPGGYEFEVQHPDAQFGRKHELQALEAWLAHVAERLKEQTARVEHFPSVWTERSSVGFHACTKCGYVMSTAADVCQNCNHISISPVNDAGGEGE